MERGRGVCEACGQPLPRLLNGGRISDQELNVLSAWWFLRSPRAVARLLGRSEQTIKNQLMSARRRHGIHSTTQLAQAYMADLRTIDEVLTHHNVARRKAA